MGAIDHFLKQGVRFKLQSADAIVAFGSLDDALRVAIREHKAQLIHELQWTEFEHLLAAVAPAYNTPAHEYAVIRDAAQADLPAALDAYRTMAAQLQREKAGAAA